MSKTINIIVDRTTQQATGDKIRTTLMEGGSQDWIPQEEYVDYIEKENVTIDENGNYLPSDFSCDAIGTVTVKLGDGEGDGGRNKYYGPGTITGIDPDTGIETTISTDTEGNIVKTPVVPEGILITNPPDTVTYSNGATIDYTGIVVCAYRSLAGRVPFSNPDWDGPRHNQVPFSELTFPVAIATRDSSATYPSSLPTSYCTQPIPFASSFTHTDPMTGTEYAWTGDAGVIFFLLHNTTNDYSVMYSASKTPSYTYRQPDGAKFYLNSRQTYKGQSVYCFQCGLFPSGYTCSLIPFDATNQALDKGGLEAAYIALYGIITGPGSIPVQWQTDYQTEPYEDTFDITVT